jgi:hypothetical protein
MITVRYWKKHKSGKITHDCMGVFLFGFIPLYLSIEKLP